MSDKAPRAWSKKYPPIGQAFTGLPTQYEIHYADGVLRLTGAMAAVAASHESLPNWDTSPAFASVLSGAPGYLLKNDVLVLALAPDEMYRLLRHNLRPDEFFKLAQTVGVFYEISGEFYDEATGLAIKPLHNGEERAAREAVKALPHLFIIQNEVGMLFPHSVVNQATADGHRRALLAQGIVTHAIPLQAVKGKQRAELVLLGNHVGIVEANGTIQAYGPLKSPHEWKDQLMQRKDAPPARYSLSTVNSFFIADA